MIRTGSLALGLTNLAGEDDLGFDQLLKCRLVGKFAPQRESDTVELRTRVAVLFEHPEAAHTLSGRDVHVPSEVGPCCLEPLP